MSDGTLHILNPARYRKQLASMQLADGEEVELRITRAEEAKRAAQVRLWFACIRELSDHTGYDVKEMHELAKAAVTEPDWPTSLGAYTKDQLSAAITKLLQWAAESVGCVLKPEAA